ncbi:MAG TPA: NADH-quinone oxidoreductase subunit NuoH [bacterium]|nr:NADH-quinone oxidoreductase subunit NuoH [bacterium]
MITSEKIVNLVAGLLAQLYSALGLQGIAGILDRVVCAVVMFALVSGFVTFLVWMERKVSAWMQSRIGPNRVGPFGLLQTIADAIKLTTKEDVKPAKRDKFPYFIAPILAFVATFMGLIVVPFDDKVVVADLNIGVLYIIAITSFTVIAILSAGWSSNNKYSLLGGFRSAAQIVSYEVPLVLSLVPIIMITGTLNFSKIVEYQAQPGNHWFVFLQLPAFLIFVAAATAEANRAPFDIPEAESELTGGFHTEYSGVKFAMFFLGEYIAIVVSTAVAATVFLGGWLPVHTYIPFVDHLLGMIPGIVWFVGKVLALIYVIMAFRWTFPRLRVDQLMDFGWKVLIPIAIVNILVTGGIVLAMGGGN